VSLLPGQGRPSLPPGAQARRKCVLSGFFCFSHGRGAVRAAAAGGPAVTPLRARARFPAQVGFLENLPDSHTVAACLEVYKRCVARVAPRLGRAVARGGGAGAGTPLQRRAAEAPPTPRRRLLRQGDLQECVDVLGACPARPRAAPR
jgi:hypothetical protein